MTLAFGVLGDVGGGRGALGCRRRAFRELALGILAGCGIRCPTDEQRCGSDQGKRFHGTSPIGDSGASPI